jgi:IS30 family transposase
MKKGKIKREMIPNRVSIDKRFLGANNRTRYGHWERDTIVSGKKGNGCLVVAQERKSRLILVEKAKTMSSMEHSLKTKELTKNMLVKSYTYDNGIENKNYEKLGIPSFFCDPYSSWQKGGIENANRMIRRYIPKGTNISKISDKYIQKIIDKINKKPRKILGYRSALEVARASGVLLRN